MIRIVELSGEDLSRAAELWAQATAARPLELAPVTPNPADHETLTTPRPGAWTLGGWDSDALVAITHVTPAREADGAGAIIPGLAHISMVAVTPGRWGKGIGQEILGAALDRIVGEGYDAVQLWTQVTNTRAQRLYERNGFTRTGREIDQERGRITQYRLELPMPDSPTDLSHLDDGVVVLRPFAPADADPHLAGEDGEIARWLSGGASTAETVRWYIHRTLTSWRRGGPMFAFAVCRYADGALIGSLELNLASERFAGMAPGDANLSYGIHAHARRQAYASRAVALVEPFAAARGVRRLVIRVEPENVASIGVPLKVGYARTGEVVNAHGRRLVVFVKSLAASGA